MTVFNLGSINADFVYHVPHLPGPGETLSAAKLTRGLGGKGANMSVATARAGARVVHIGGVGKDGRWAVERLLEYGVDTRHIAETEAATGHAVIYLDPEAENTIVIFPGANREVTAEMVEAALSEAGPGDTLIFQNETSMQREAAEAARAKGMRVAYAAAPFEAASVRAVMDLLDLLVLNAVEAEQLQRETGSNLADLPVSDIVVTRGAEGCLWISQEDRAGRSFEALKVEAVDTTGAGDTFTGYLVACLDRGMPMAQAVSQAMRAAALMVTRHGTADVIPDLKEIEDHVFGR
ncbi:ribokinase [Sulfitobacter sp. D35]|uniref:ribokinase n=1 Tax=Sulfitobacter sp. D35 TaxID=3083252 RepID=UPI00296E7D23|nr:ribokinase [Sulfitobacter sp. D35]MDW4498061.1 ribokinase [Sulfitobacter sp. D35]